MHWVTKVFIVGAAVLSVLLAALVMAYSVNVKEIRDEHANLVAAKLAAEQSSATQLAQAAEERVRQAQNLEARIAENQALLAQVSQLQTENSALRAEALKAQMERESVTAKIAGLGETARTQQTLIQTLSDELRALRESELKFRQREIELIDRNNDLEAQKEVLTQSTRALGEQIAELRQQMENLRNPVAGGSEADQIIRPLSVFRGQVTEVSKDPATGAPIARINLGSNDGVRNNMELSLARGSQYLGKIIIINTDLQTAIGRVDTMGIRDARNKPVEVRQGDEVLSFVR